MAEQNKLKSGKTGRHLTVTNCIMFIILFGFAAIQIFPLIWLLNFSFASSTEMFTKGILIKPERIRWDNYYKAFTDGHFLLYLKNSLIINTLAVLIVLVTSIMAAFACTRMRWKLSPVVRNLLLLGMMIPIHATILPNYIIYDKFHITDTIWAILIPYVAFSLPQGLFLTSGYMQSIPREIEEAAIIDGCGIYRLIVIIITPMLRVSLVTVSIMTYLNNWNEFIMAMTYLSTRTWKTLPFSILEFVGQYRSDYATQFAVMALTAAPAVIIYIILNRHITKGVALGAVKG
jgi:raffinose/stachyose/melibiose transport system permease protein